MEKARPVSLKEIRIRDNFWDKYRRLVREAVSYTHLEEPLLFSSAVEALVFLETETVDVVLTDLYMPCLLYTSRCV